MFFDPLFLLFAIPGLLLGIYAQTKLTSAYNHYRRVRVRANLSGAEAAREILDRAGLHNVPVGEVRGHLTDHYDPTKRALMLSGENYHGRSIAAVGVAAHEAGHALQHQAAYAPLKFRMMLVPITNIASTASYFIFAFGWILHWSNLITIAIAAFAIVTLFQLVTLPVEFDASRRAKAQLLKIGLVTPQENPHVAKVLNAAAMTYVAAMVSSAMQLLYFIFMARRRD